MEPVVQSNLADPKRRFELIDAMRGVAALAVVLPHAVGLFIYPHDSWLTSLFLRLADYGRSSVEVFFVVSGFAIAYSLRDSATTGFSLRRFMLRRAVRLDPPYWVGMLWAALVIAIRARATGQPVPVPSLGQVVAHVLYLQDILKIDQLNIVFWTLCLEFQLYLVFALTMRGASALGERPRATTGLLAATDMRGWLMVTAFFASLILSHTVWPMRPGWFVPFFYLFLSGALAAWRVLGRISDRLFVICLVSMGLGLFLRPELQRVLGLLAALLIYVAIHRSALHRWLTGWVAQWLGRISYSIYLVHAPLTFFFLGLRTRIASNSPALSIALLAGTYLFTLALATLLHVTIEVPCLRLAQQLKRPRPLRGSRVAPPA